LTPGTLKFAADSLARLLLFDSKLSNAQANLNADARVHPKDVGGRASDRSEPNNESAVLKTKVFVPDIRAGIEKPCQLVGVRVDAGEVRPFFVVTEGANIIPLKLGRVDPVEPIL
jgi:hypothetical protein